MSGFYLKIWLTGPTDLKCFSPSQIVMNSKVILKRVKVENTVN